MPVKILPRRFHIYIIDFITKLPDYNGYNAIFTVIYTFFNLIRFMPCVVGD